MGTVSRQELLRLWTLEEITPEMAIGHLIQNLVKQHKTHEALRMSLVKYRDNIKDLLEQTERQNKALKTHDYTLGKLRADVDGLLEQLARR
jgi:hypothetical protein